MAITPGSISQAGSLVWLRLLVDDMKMLMDLLEVDQPSTLEGSFLELQFPTTSIKRQMEAMADLSEALDD